MEMMVSRFIPVSLIVLLATCTAATSAFAGATILPDPVPEPSSLALLAGGVGAVYLVRKLRRGK
jgi:PEP-CTERM motif-containing protein